MNTENDDAQKGKRKTSVDKPIEVEAKVVQAVPFVEANELALLKKEGEWDKIKDLIQNGQVQLVPTPALQDLVRSKKNFRPILFYVYALQKSITPLAERHEDLEEYFKRGKDGSISPDLMNLATEFGPYLAKIAMGRKPRPTRILRIFQEGVDLAALKSIDTKEIAQALESEGIDFTPTIQFLKTFGFKIGEEDKAKKIEE